RTHVFLNRSASKGAVRLTAPPSKRFDKTAASQLGSHDMTQNADQLPFRDPRLTRAERVADLLGRLTLDEKIGLLHQYHRPVERLGIGPFKTGTEALHGLAWLGKATVFPQVIALGATWNPELVEAVGAATADEVLAYHHRDPAKAGRNVWAPT